MTLYLLFIAIPSLAEPVIYKGHLINSQKLSLQEGKALLDTFFFCKDQFKFVAQQDLTVWFNGTK